MHENKENIPIASLGMNGEIVISQNLKSERKQFKKRKDTEPDEVGHVFSITGNASEVSISEGMMQGIPDSQIPINKNKFTYNSV